MAYFINVPSIFYYYKEKIIIIALETLSFKLTNHYIYTRPDIKFWEICVFGVATRIACLWKSKYNFVSWHSVSVSFLTLFPFLKIYCCWHFRSTFDVLASLGIYFLFGETYRNDSLISNSNGCTALKVNCIYLICEKQQLWRDIKCLPPPHKQAFKNFEYCLVKVFLFVSLWTLVNKC